MKTSMYSKEATLHKRKAAKVAERNRRSVVTIVSLALVIVLAIGGTVAFLVDQTASVTNTFSPASTTTEIVEEFDGSAKENVAIKNTGDVSAYVRASVVVNWVKLDADGVTVLDVVPAVAGDYAIAINTALDGVTGAQWLHDASNDVYYYSLPLPAGGSTHALVSSCVPVSGKAPGGQYVLSVDVLTQAIQAMPATAVEQAWPRADVSGGKLVLAG